MKKITFFIFSIVFTSQINITIAKEYSEIVSHETWDNLETDLSKFIYNVNWRQIEKYLGFEINFSTHPASGGLEKTSFGYAIINDADDTMEIIVLADNKKGNTSLSILIYNKKIKKLVPKSKVLLKGCLNWNIGPFIDIKKIGKDKVLAIIEGGNATVIQLVLICNNKLKQLYIKNGYFTGKYLFYVVGRASFGEYIRIVDNTLKIYEMKYLENSNYKCTFGVFKLKKNYFIEEHLKQYICNSQEIEHDELELEKFFGGKIEQFFESRFW